MLIVDSQIHIWENAKMSGHHRQIPTYSKDDALKEMARGRRRCRVDPSAELAAADRADRDRGGAAASRQVRDPRPLRGRKAGEPRR